MTVRIDAKPLPFTINVTDTDDLAEVAGWVADWSGANKCCTFALGDEARYVVQFGLIDLIQVSRLTADGREAPEDRKPKPVVSIAIRDVTLS